MYRVVHEFHDLQDAVQVKGGVVYHHYDVGDKYPRENGPTPSDARIAELCSPFNRLEAALIAPETAAETEAAGLQETAGKAAEVPADAIEEAAGTMPAPEPEAPTEGEKTSVEAAGEAEPSTRPKRTRKKK